MKKIVKNPGPEDQAFNDEIKYQFGKMVESNMKYQKLSSNKPEDPVDYLDGW